MPQPKKTILDICVALAWAKVDTGVRNAMSSSNIIFWTNNANRIRWWAYPSKNRQTIHIR